MTAERTGVSCVATARGIVTLVLSSNVAVARSAGVR